MEISEENLRVDIGAKTAKMSLLNFKVRGSNSIFFIETEESLGSLRGPKLNILTD